MCWWVKTKSAPLPERPCEQLTYCAKNESEQWDYINRVAKRHYCRITGKEKATRYGGPATQISRYPQRMSITNNATFSAGGQSVTGKKFRWGYSCSLSLRRWRRLISCRIFSGKNPADLFSGSNGLLSVCFLVIHQPFGSLRFHTCNGRVSLYSLRNCSRAKAHGANLSDSCSIFLRRLFRAGDGVLVDSLLVIVCTCKAMRRSTSHHGADSDYSDSLALRRWRRLISPRMAVTMNCAVLSPVSLTCSIASTTSCGARACNFCDLLLIWSLSISGFLCDYWNPVYTKKTKTKCLKWIPLGDYTGIQLSNYHSMQTRLERIAVLSQPLTTNDSESIEVAMRNHTTHPQGRDSHNLNKYIWRFIALSTAQPRVITIEATSEQEARQQSPDGCVMVFAARIRQEVRHVQ
ncbi:host cell division inhibitor Icd-like protein [Escherichia coli]|nr:host cell division inhibitor Icd-like protein [Escherichia coli]EFC5289907.1 host cell division inhibitor Icd-like protein [Escherichia coli]EFC5347131.1 host cell division inhibitor Icd-like protein [Escherichia coli]EGM6340143.1 host cell division inhibitor Icd-like protein [Escherichia coli]EIH2566542.1 host cell division inhibitor Icd-like protein [Escherichia coli]